MRCAIAFLVFFLPVLSWLFRSDLCVVRSADNESSDHLVFFTSIRSPSKVKAVAHSSSLASAFCYSVGQSHQQPHRALSQGFRKRAWFQGSTKANSPSLSLSLSLSRFFFQALETNVMAKSSIHLG
ncbi:hypothetical protein VDGL01_03859 [Verticillium dahliae]